VTTQRILFRCRRLCFCMAIMVVGASCALSQDPPTSSSPTSKPQATVPVPAPACNVADGFTLSAVGDIIYSEPLSAIQDEPFTKLLPLLRNADATFGNLENTLIDLRSFNGYPQAEYGGMHLIGSPTLATDMRNMGFNLVSRANNHTTDWGIEGMRATDQAADAAGLVHAGTGYNLADARAAHYLQTSKGRVALVSMTSSAAPSSAASDPVGRAPGRPGLNALRIKTSVIVSPDMLQSLRKIHDALPPEVLKAEADAKRTMQPDGQTEKADELSLLEINYRVGENPVHVSYAMNDGDLREILKSIRQGKQNSDFLVATIHSHEPDWSDQPADFLVKLAHSSIDEGADAFIGHGPHLLKGIEIYKGKPIFYSLGNFFFQVVTQEPIPAELYEALNGDARALTENEIAAKLLKAYFTSPVWYQSVIAVSRFDRGQLSEVRLYPVDLGAKAGNVNQGIPRFASPPVAKTILENLQRLSRPFGTTIANENGVGVIRFQK
jgi:poly-gamma-glutamate capsule biosynthesis protein CapA/YwtB (metallophosphatase superfamily)